MVLFVLGVLSALLSGFILMSIQRFLDKKDNVVYHVRTLRIRLLKKWFHTFLRILARKKELKELKNFSSFQIGLVLLGTFLMALLLGIFIVLCGFLAWVTINANHNNVPFTDEMWIAIAQQLGLYLGVCFTFYLMTRIKKYQLFFSNRPIVPWKAN